MSFPEKLPNAIDKADILLLHVIDGHSSHSCRRRSRYKIVFDCIDDSIIISEKDGKVIPSDNNFTSAYVLREDSGHVHWNEKIELRIDSKEQSSKVRVRVLRDLDIVETSKKYKKKGDSNSQPVYAEGSIPFDRLLPDALLSILSLRHQSPQLSDCNPIEFSMDLQISKNMFSKRISPRSGSADELLLHDEIIREAEDNYHDALKEIYQHNIINNSQNENPNNTKEITSPLRNIFTLKMSFLFIPLQSLCTKIGSLEISDKIIEMKRIFFGYPLKSSSIKNSKKFILDNIGDSTSLENNLYRARTKDMWSTSHRKKNNLIGIFEELHEMCSENYFPSEASGKSNFNSDVTTVEKNENKINENKKKNKFLLAENEIPSRSFVQFLKSKISKFWSHRVEELIFELKMCVVSKKIANNNGGLIENVLTNQNDFRDFDSEDENKNENDIDEDRENINPLFLRPLDIVESDKIMNLLRSGARVRIIHNKINKKINDKINNEKARNNAQHDVKEKINENFNKNKSKILSPSINNITAAAAGGGDDDGKNLINEIDKGNCNNAFGGPIVIVRFSESTAIR